jgi:hypothetical protein
MKYHLRKIILSNITTYSIEKMNEQIQINRKQFQKMIFLTNALDQGWKIQKADNSYIFTKKHENKKEVFQSDYLEKFIETNRSL